MARSREIHVHNAHTQLRLDRRAVVRALRLLDTQAERFEGGLGEGELSIAFLTDAALARVHADFLQHPSTTDVITFEAQPALGSAGEICVSADTARSFAANRDRDFSEELTLYVVHGWLHLAGYDDLKPEKKRRMRAAEARAMELLRSARALPTYRLI